MPGPVSDSFSPPDGSGARNVVTCVFCGHEYESGTPRAKAKALYEHVAVCDKHPAAEFRRRAEAAEAKIAALKALQPEADALCGSGENVYVFNRDAVDAIIGGYELELHDE